MWWEFPVNLRCFYCLCFLRVLLFGHRKTAVVPKLPFIYRCPEAFDIDRRVFRLPCTFIPAEGTDDGFGSRLNTVSGC